ncbi:hypothetical protein FB451DRAFT_428408 [Mycena latifolia]|nr:hypothetical protein FB451DRAFT_428408 [Mycena latifolia]
MSDMSALSAELARYDDEMGRLQEQLLQLAEDRATLQADYDDCRGLLSPIRRLPAETLVEIFALSTRAPNVNVFIPAFGGYSSETVAQGIAALAQAPLLRLSQVCARWHTIAIGTPALWSRIQLDGNIWDPSRLKKVSRLFNSALERSAHTPLTVIIRNFTKIRPSTLLLLSQHSERWQKLTCMCSFSDLRRLSAIKGQLPRLESLEVQAWGDDGASMPDIFEISPRLKRVKFCGEGRALSKLPLERPSEVHWHSQYISSHEVIPPTSFMPRLSDRAKFTLSMTLLGSSDPAPVLAVTSNISAFKIEIGNEHLGFSNLRALDGFLANLTLPSLEALELKSTHHPPTSIPLPQTEFLSLSARSSFHDHLRSLHLYHISITEASNSTTRFIRTSYSRACGHAAHSKSSFARSRVTSARLTPRSSRGWTKHAARKNWCSHFQRCLSLLLLHRQPPHAILRSWEFSREAAETLHTSQLDMVN